MHHWMNSFLLFITVFGSFGLPPGAVVRAEGPDEHPQKTNTEPPPENSCLYMLQSRPVVIFGGYSSARYLAPRLRSMGYRVGHVHGTGKPPSASLAKTFHPEDYDFDIRHTGDSEQTLAELRALKPLAIIPGAESDVLFADYFSDRLKDEFGLLSNGVQPARRDKYRQGNHLKNAGIPVAKQLKSRNLNEVLKWVRRKKLLKQYPYKVVVKPLQSSGSDGVSVCNNEKELREAFKKIFMKPNHHGVMNTDVLVQEFLDGPEYVVNTVSDLGRHIVTDMWLYEKKEIVGGGTIYQHDRLLPFQGDVQAQLVPYTFRVLDALGIKTGWGHAEIKMTSKGPRLIEIGARMMGSGQPILVEDALSEGQIGLGIQAYMHRGSLASHAQGYELKNQAVLISLTSDGEGTRLSLAHQDALTKLPGYKRHSFFMKEGDTLPRTVDMDTIIGQVELVHPNPVVLEASLKAIHDMERDGLFFVPIH